MKSRVTILIFILSAAVFLCSAQATRADGIIVPPHDYPVYETNQKAALFFDAESKQEDLVLAIVFNGSARDFGWIIPTPSKPLVEKTSDDFFSRLETLSQPKDNLLEKLQGSLGGDIIYTMGNAQKEANDYRSTVEVWSEKRVGALDVAVLSADKPEDLLEWLKENGYNLPTLEYPDPIYYLEDLTMRVPEGSNSGVLKPYSTDEKNTLLMLQDYIDDNWYFVAAKVNGLYDGLSATTSNQGQINPIRLTFSTNEPVFPLRLTSLAKKNLPLTLYMFADSRMHPSNFTVASDTKTYWGDALERVTGYQTTVASSRQFSVTYANWVTPQELETLTKEINKTAWFMTDKNLFLTKLQSQYLYYGDMKSDIFFAKARSNTTVNAGEMDFTDWLLMPVYLLVYGPARLVELVGGGYYPYFNNPITAFGSLIAMGFLIIVAFAWFVGIDMLLKRAKRKIVKTVLYVLQFPAVWYIAFIITIGVSLPAVILTFVIGAGSDIVAFNAIIYGTLTYAAVTIGVYRLLRVISGKLLTKSPVIPAVKQ